MSKGFQSPGSAAASDRVAQHPEFVLPAPALAERARVALAASVDAATLAEQIGAMALEEFSHEGRPACFAMKVLADRVALLANGVCQALDEVPSDIPELTRALYPAGIFDRLPEAFKLEDSQEAAGAA